jgi:hypothetical protein
LLRGAYADGVLALVRRILPIVAVLACAGAARAETWRLVGSESPPIEWDYADGGFSRSGASAHYVREPNGERLDVQFTWQVPQELTAGVAAEVPLAADVVAGWPCRPLFLGARVFLAATPCAFCADGRDVGAGICAEHAQGTRTFRIEPGNFGQPEARLHVHVTDGSLFSGIAATYVYARDSGPPTATATRTRTPSSPPTPTATRTRSATGQPTPTATRTHTASGPPTATATRTRTRTPTGGVPPTSTRVPSPSHTPTPSRTPTITPRDHIACGETRRGTLSDDDVGFFDPGSRADEYLVTVSDGVVALFDLQGDGFDPYLGLADANIPDVYNFIAIEPPPLVETLYEGRYLVVASHRGALAPGSYPYALTMYCGDHPPPTRTPSRAPSPSASPSPSPTAAAPTPTPVPPTPTGTATRQATRTPPPAPSATATREVCEIGGEGGIAGGSGCEVDLVADHIEVIQSIQDLENSVDLVAYKRTFVRFHVHALGREARATATLQLELGGPGGLATDLSHPPITVWQRPDRGLLEDSFLFELPSLYLSGRVFITATVNPDNAPHEDRRGNNRLFETIRYEEPLPFELVLYEISGPGGQNAPAPLHVLRILGGLESMYPIAEPLVWHRSLTIDGPVNFRKSNQIMETCRRLDLAHEALDTPSSRARHYALWDDVDVDSYKAKPLRGLAGGIPAFVASGAGVATRTVEARWDSDGSAADMIAAHELGHILGRWHAEFCGAEEGKPFPNAHGFISPVGDGVSAIWGFDTLKRELYPPFVWDIMTYCPGKWISDVMYEALLRQYLPASGSTARGAPAAEVRLLVVGTIDPGTGAVTLEPLFSMPALVADEPVAGTGYTIDQYDANGGLLARHPFLPRRMEPLVAGGGSAETPELLLFSETVRYASGAQRLAIVGPGVSHAVAAGMASPVVTVLQPDRRAPLAGDRITVAWEGFDADGDPLTYRLQYSPDDGASWITVAAALTDTQIDVDRTQLRASESGRFRVWVSDGLHTGFGDSSSFTLPNVAPSAEIVAPAEDATFLAGQTVTLVGRGYDVDQGPLPSAQLGWRSSLDGELGSGRMLGRADLSVGEHLITFEARDRPGAAASDTVTVRVVATAAELPPVPDQLLVAPALVAFDTRVALVEATVTIDNRGAAPLPWQATASDPWIELDPDAGQTRAQIRVGLGAGLGAGVHEGAITFSTEEGGASAVVLVRATVGACPGDCNEDRVVTIDELLSGVNLLLADASGDRCGALDVNDDGRMTIDELIRAINSALNGCA